MEICLRLSGVKSQSRDFSVSLPSSFPILHTPVLCLERRLVAPEVEECEFKGEIANYLPLPFNTEFPYSPVKMSKTLEDTQSPISFLHS